MDATRPTGTLRRSIPLVVLLAAAALVAACDAGSDLTGSAVASGDATDTSDRGEATDTTPAGGADELAEPGITAVRELTVDGRDRSYRFRLPSGAHDGLLPLVVMLHGGLGSGRQAEEAYGWNELADREGVAMAYPDGLNRSWAVSDECCGPSVAAGVDEVTFIEAMVDELVAAAPIDPERIYVTGISNGGMLTYELACHSDRVTAVAPVAATMLDDCPSPRPLPVLHIHGTADASVPYGGGPGAGPSSRAGIENVTIDGPGAEELAGFWRRVDGCETSTASTEGPMTISTAACADGMAVELVTVDGAGHQWPGADGNPVLERALGLDPPSDALDATETIWAFFADTPGR